MNSGWIQKVWFCAFAWSLINAEYVIGSDVVGKPEVVLELTAEEVDSGVLSKALLSLETWSKRCEQRRLDVSESIIARENGNDAKLYSRDVRLVVGDGGKNFVFTRVRNPTREEQDGAGKENEQKRSRLHYAVSLIANDDGVYFRELGSAKDWSRTSRSIGSRKVALRDYRMLPLMTAAKVHFTIKQDIGPSGLLKRLPTGGFTYDDGSLLVEWKSQKTKTIASVYFSGEHDMLPVRFTIATYKVVDDVEKRSVFHKLLVRGNTVHSNGHCKMSRCIPGHRSREVLA